MVVWMQTSQESRTSEERNAPILIVSPDSGVQMNWEESLWQFTTNVTYVVIHNSKVCSDSTMQE